MENRIITLEEILSLLPETTTLQYVDYRESLDEQTEAIQQCIAARNWEALIMALNDSGWEQEMESKDEYRKQLRKDLQAKYSLKKKQAKILLRVFEEEIDEAIYSRCDDNILKDLLRNTGSLIAHYDTGYYMEADSWNWSTMEVEDEVAKIKAFLEITSEDYDHRLFNVVAQATYGGNLLIYFNLDVEEYLNNSEAKSMTFTDYSMGIVDHHNGSGDVLDDSIKEPFTIQLNPENIFLEKSIKYNWTYSIAGMGSDWCDDTKIAYSDTQSGVEVESSKTNNLLNKEAEYNKTFKEGGCTFGDMDTTRHRNTPYRNDYPCGSKCTRCGTFWID